MRPAPRWLVLLCVIVAAGIEGCAAGRMGAPVGRPSASGQTPAPRPEVHVVGRGDTLYAIAWRYGLDYRDLAAWNGVRDPNRIYPGQRLRLRPSPRGVRPAPASASTTPKKAPAEGQARAKSGASGGGVPARRSRAQERAPGADDAKIEGWAWPVRGKVVARFSPAKNKGIDIAGRLGDSVKAASAGRVVYSGGGLLGYGNLIIVKHNKRYLSAYAHNQEVFVREGETVQRGQRIAAMGRSGTDRVKLHFEIRRDGKPVNPLRYLP